jgi:hypothetical protein
LQEAGEDAARQLRDLKIEANYEALVVDVTKDNQIDCPAEFIASESGKLDGTSSPSNPAGTSS